MVTFVPRRAAMSRYSGNKTEHLVEAFRALRLVAA